MIQVLIKKLFDDVVLPAFQTDGAAGADCMAYFKDGKPVTLLPGERAYIPFGWAAAVPFGYEMQVRPRSGLALKRGISLTNSPGTVDSDFRGEVGAIVHNLGTDSFSINHGDRIAQIVIAAVPAIRYVAVTELPETERGSSGFGSTGVSTP